jgi:hypothetical protein
MKAMKAMKTPLALLLATVGFVGQAHAADLVFDSLGDAGSILFQTTWDSANLSATMGFTLSSWNATSATFAVTVANNSSGPGTNRLMSFGIDVVTPTLTGSSEDSGMWDSELTTTLPSFQQVDLCIYSSNGCSGGDINDGLGEGGSSSFNLTLTTSGNFLTNGISFTSPYGVKFQDVGATGESYEFPGCIVGTPGCGGGGGQNEIPEPTSVLLVGLGLVGLAASRCRKAV